MDSFKLFSKIIEDQEMILTPELSGEDGIVAIGGDFEPELLLRIYRQGIFPWPENDHIKLWFCPPKRCVLYPSEVKVSKSLKSLISKNKFKISIDSVFEKVISNCAKVTTERESTWITPKLKKAFIELHKMGHAHSFEVWQDNELVGGLYGLAIGKQFSGESMFHLTSNASKVAFLFLNRMLEKMNFKFLDCQVSTEHLESLGTHEWERELFLEEHGKAIKMEGMIGSWKNVNKGLGINTTADLI